MKNPPTWRDRLRSRLDATPSNPAPPGSRLASFRRLYRWLNLTLVHQGAWPLLILLLAAPPVRPTAAPWAWALAATGAPALAALAALLYLAQRRPPSGAADGSVAVAREPAPADTARRPAADPFVASLPVAVTEQTRRPRTRSGLGERGQGSDRARQPDDRGDGLSRPVVGAITAMLQTQARLLLFGVIIVLAAARLVIGPPISTGAYLLFGVADVLAFQLIHFGVVAGSFAEEDQGQAAAVLLFGLSWGLRELLLAGVGVGNADLGLAFGGGLAVGLLSRLLRRWPGGFWAAAAGHWLVIYLVLGFIN